MCSLENIIEVLVFSHSVNFRRSHSGFISFTFSILLMYYGYCSVNWQVIVFILAKLLSWKNYAVHKFLKVWLLLANLPFALCHYFGCLITNFESTEGFLVVSNLWSIIVFTRKSVVYSWNKFFGGLCWVVNFYILRIWALHYV